MDLDPKRPAVFLLEPQGAAIEAGHEPKRVPMLDNGLTPVTGRLWFVTDVVVSGRYLDVQDADDDGLFGIVTDTLHMGDVPAVVYDPRTAIATVRFYPNGLASPDICEIATVHGAEVSLERVLDAVDHVHRTQMVTPEAQPKAAKLWLDGDKWWPAQDAEDRTLVYLKVGLAAAFPTCTVRQEQTGVPGRLDLEIEERDPIDRAKLTRHAVLELKVLRSFRSSGAVVPESENAKWVESGVKQAAAYRDDRSAQAAALCCFDMRRDFSGELCFAQVTDLAIRLNVRLRVWFLFATSKQYREFLARGA
ncbi:MAG TPA: hypothetical protein VH583_17245 [Vicinamibacterales bacterium]